MNIKTTSNELDIIAQNYHLNENIPDKFIEDICQEYCCNWLESLIDEDNLNVLELGYGEGITSSILSKKTKNYTILEGSSHLTEVINKKYPDINVINTLFEDYETNEKYDRVFALHVFEHVDDSVSLARYMKQWLTDDGKMIIIVPNKESVHRRLALDMGLIPTLDALSERDKLVGHQKVYSLSELKKDFEDAGYEIIEEKGFFLKTLPNSMMLDYSKELIYSLNKCSENISPELTANIAIIVKVKK